jgi:hypothetical protein
MKQLSILSGTVFFMAIISAFAFHPKQQLISSNRALFQQLNSPQSCQPILCSDDNTRPSCTADVSSLYRDQDDTNPAVCVTPETTFKFQPVP